MAFADLVLSGVLSVFPSLFDRASNIFIGKQKMKRVTAVVSDYRTKASMLATSERFRKSLDNKYLIDELIVHCSQVILPRKEVASIFVFGSKTAEFKNEQDQALTLELVDAIRNIICETSSSPDAAALKATIEIEGSEIRQAISDLNHGSLPLLEQAILSVHQKRSTLEELELLNPNKANDITTDYISAYSSACRGIKPSMRGISALSDALVSSLASVLFSSGFYDECILALSSAPSNTNYIQSIVMAVKNGNVFPEPNDEGGVSLNSPYAAFALSLNAETALKMRAIPQALEFFEQTESSLNPIARLRLEECKLWIRLTKNNADQSAIFDYCEAIPAWISAALAKELSEPLCTAFELLSEDVYPEIDNYAAYESLKPWLGAAEKMRMLPTETNPKAILDIFEWAIDHEEKVLACMAADKLLSIDERNKAQLANYFENSNRNLLSDYLYLDFFIARIKPNLGESEYDSLESSFIAEPRYYLRKYSLYHNDEHPCECMEIAISLMKETSNQPCIELSSIWMPYLVLENREQEIEQITTRFSEYLSGGLAEMLLASLYKHGVSEEVAGNIAASLSHSKMRDPRVYVAISKYYFAKDNIPEATHNAFRAFSLHQDEVSAALCFQGFTQLSATVPDDLIEYALGNRSAAMDVSLALVEHANGNPTMRDSYLIHAILLGEPSSDQALKGLLKYHVGSRNGIEEPSEIVPGTTVFLLENGTGVERVLSFHENASVLPYEGCIALFSEHHSQSSSTFTQCRKQHVGQNVTIDNRQYTIAKIVWCIDYFCQRAFDSLVQSNECVALTFNEDDPRSMSDQLAEQLKALESDRSKQTTYFDGLDIGNGAAIFFGIETGAKLFPLGSIEFMLEVMTSRILPFRRLGYDSLTPFECNNGFILSYNAIVLLSQMELPDEAIDALSQRAVVTSSTRNRLLADIRDATTSTDQTAGRLALIEGRPVLFEKEESEKRLLYDRCATLQRFVENLKQIDPQAGVHLRHTLPVLSQNSVLDIQTALSTGRVIVTEDYLEALLIDVTGEVSRCTVFSLFEACGFGPFAAFTLFQCFEQWGAEPPIDNKAADQLREFTEIIRTSTTSELEDDSLSTN